MSRFLLFGLSLLPLHVLAVETTTFQSNNHQTALIELFTSQGCSSCPPAEAWLQRLTNSPQLWKEVIPIALHVDYWDSLGWQDPFANTINTDRQYAYKKARIVSSVYTPSFVINGQEWRGWFTKESLPVSTAKVGVLTAQIKENEIRVNYAEKIEPLELHVAVLGFGLETSVTRGENKQRLLKEDFVLLAKTTATSSNNQWQLKLPTNTLKQAKRYGLAVWVNRINDMHPIQVTGGWLP